MSLATFLDQIFEMSKSAYRAGLGRRLHRQSPHLWQQVPESVLNEAPCTFILSTGRCGTQLLTRVLRGCGNVDVNHHAELANELQFPSRVAFESDLTDGPGFELAALCSRFEPIQTSYLNQRVFAETNNRITFLAHALHRVFKQARFVHLVRNPTGFVRSGVNAGFYAGGYYDTGRIKPTDEATQAQWNDYTQIKKVAWLWNATNKFIEQFKVSVAPDRLMTVRCEDLFQQTDVVRQVVGFTGGRSLPEKRLQRLVGRKVNAGSDGGLPKRIEDWKARDQRDLNDACPLASVYGYELGLGAPPAEVRHRMSA